METGRTAAASSETPVEKSVEQAVRIRGLIKDYTSISGRLLVRALDDLNLEIRTGEVFGLLGPNGSGKTTTIKLLLGLLNPTAGDLRVLGKPPHNVAVKSRIGYLPEETYLYRFLTAAETLDFFGRLFHIPRRERRVRIDRLLDRVGLRDARNRQVGEYSKGMARRLGLAQALINDPELVILDEPTSGLDPLGTREVKDLIIEMRGDGRTILLSSHLLADVQDVCDRIAILYKGILRSVGTVSELLAESGRVQVTAENLDPAGMENLRRSVEEAGGKVVQVGPPRERLEDYFLRIVAESKRDAAGGGNMKRAESGENAPGGRRDSVESRDMGAEDKGQ